MRRAWGLFLRARRLILVAEISIGGELIREPFTESCANRLLRVGDTAAGRFAKQGDGDNHLAAGEVLVDLAGQFTGDVERGHAMIVGGAEQEEGTLLSPLFVESDDKSV